MFNLEIINLINKKSKIEREKIRDIFSYFSEDCTATQTAKKLNISRQTVNSYYKIFRELLFNQLFFIKKNNLNISYLRVNQKIYYYLEDIFIYIEKNDPQFEEINDLLKNDIENIFLKNKKINAVKLLYNNNQKKFIILGFYKTSKNLEDFINIRLKKFRGIKKENISIHIKESLFRFNNNPEEILRQLNDSFLI